MVMNMEHVLKLYEDKLDNYRVLYVQTFKPRQWAEDCQIGKDYRDNSNSSCDDEEQIKITSTWKNVTLQETKARSQAMGGWQPVALSTEGGSAN